MHMSRTLQAIAAISLAALLIAFAGIPLASSVSAGSGCTALLKAAKKGYRGDLAPLRACRAQQQAEKDAVHSGIAKTKKAANSEPLLTPRQKRRRYEERWHESNPIAGNPLRRKVPLGSEHAFKQRGHKAGYEASPKRQRQLNAEADIAVKALKTMVIMESLMGGVGRRSRHH